MSILLPYNVDVVINYFTNTFNLDLTTLTSYETLIITILSNLYFFIYWFFVIYIALKLLPLLEKALINKTKYVDLHIEFDYRTNLKDFIKLLRSEGVKIISVDLNPSYSQSGLSVYEITIQLATKTLTKDCKKMIEEWSKLEYVEWIERV